MKRPFMFVGAATIGLCLCALAWSAELSPDNQTKLLKNVRVLISSISDAEYQEILRMAGIVATPGIPLP